MVRILKIVRIIWITAALCFMGWLVYSMQSRGFPATVLTSDDRVTVTNSADLISFVPVANPQPTGLIFYPGAPLDPRLCAAGAPTSRTAICCLYYQLMLRTGNAAIEWRQAGRMPAFPGGTA